MASSRSSTDALDLPLPLADPGPAQGLRYRAFISYSHADSRTAKRLHRALEAFRTPSTLYRCDGSKPPARLSPVFLDREELATATRLSDSIEAALDASAALIVVCSPAAAASRWVDAEIRRFRLKHPRRPVLAFVVDGDPARDARYDAGAAVPAAMTIEDLDLPDGAICEPLAADARSTGDGFHGALLKLVAGLLGVGYDQLRRREQARRRRRAMLSSAASLMLAAVFALLAWQATRARDVARQAEASAQLELQSERQTRRFLLSLFELADPTQARGRELTVREVLDSAVDRIDATEFSRPAIRARYLATMGQAYARLGNNQRAVTLLQQSIDGLSQPGDSAVDAPSQRIDSRIELADLLLDTGEYAAAFAALNGAVAADDKHFSTLQRARWQVIRGDLLSFAERDDEALDAYRAAERWLTNVFEDEDARAVLAARALSGRALVAAFAERFDAARLLYRDALEQLLAAVGETHPETVVTMMSLASAEHGAGDRDAAIAATRRALSIAARMYGDESPSVGAINSNLGRFLLERGELQEAESVLVAALASDRRHRSADFDDLTYPLMNLAIVRKASGQLDQAGRLLDEALALAEKHDHRMLGPVLTLRADLGCRRAETAASALAERAVGVTAERFGDAHWYTAQARLTHAWCLATLSTRLPDGSQRDGLLVDLDTIAAQWQDANPFSLRATQQARALGLH